MKWEVGKLENCIVFTIDKFDKSASPILNFMTILLPTLLLTIFAMSCTLLVGKYEQTRNDGSSEAGKGLGVKGVKGIKTPPQMRGGCRPAQTRSELFQRSSLPQQSVARIDEM